MISFPGDRTFWLRHLHRWHWISAAISLVGMLLFAVTGITLNHASRIEASPAITSRTATLPPELLRLVEGTGNGGALPEAIGTWLDKTFHVDAMAGRPEWSAQEIYVAMPRAGGDAWQTIDRASGDVEFEDTSRGLISYLNDLHKGRNTGLAWSLFIDVFAIGCVVFSITGLLLLKLQSARRPLTWPMVAAGVAIPAAILVLFVH
ncbi:MAG: PepSY-associated TM helix domain-containing protein [Hyphomicrobiales bacterium]